MSNSLAQTIASSVSRLFGIVDVKAPVASANFNQSLATIIKFCPEAKYAVEALKTAEICTPDESGIKVTHALRQINLIGFTQPALAMDLLYAARESASACLKENSLASFMEYAQQIDIDKSVNMAWLFGRVTNLIVNHATDYEVGSQLVSNMRLVWLASGDKALELAGEAVDKRTIILDAADGVMLKQPAFRDTAAAFLNANGRPVYGDFEPLPVIIRKIESHAL